VLPRTFARVSPRTGAPVTGSIAQMLVAAVIRSRDPERYARIGERTRVEEVESVA
jgi:hypothetical protein